MTFRNLVIFAFVCLSFSKAHAYIPSHGEMPPPAFDTRLSTNWAAAVREASPDTYLVNGKLDFRSATNGLCRESQKGNLAATALWGFTLIVSRNSSEATEAGAKLLREAAERDHVPAILNLGFLFESGEFVRKDNKEAFHWFKRAAELGNDEGQFRVGVCYYHGIGIARDLTMTAKYYRLSAAQTNFTAMKSLGFLLMNGIGLTKDEGEAKHWLLRSAQEGGNRRAMYNLAVLCNRKFPDTNAMVESFQWMKQSADLGDPLSALGLSGYYLNGWGGAETNLATYRHWRLKAASLGATDAEYLMGSAYRAGDGVSRDTKNSLFWYRKAAAKNHPSALYDLALHNLQDKTDRDALKTANELMLRAAQSGHREAQFHSALGYFRGDALDCEKGKEWLGKAAENEWPKAEFVLFQMLYNGIAPVKDCPAYAKDKVAALKWLRRAADHGNLNACSILAVMLVRGTEMEKDLPEAAKLLRHAAERDHVGAQNDLGFAIFSGDVDSTDPTDGAFWCKLAISRSTDPNVSKRANVNLSNALLRLSIVQQDKLDERVKSFRPQPITENDPRVKDWERLPDYQVEDGLPPHSDVERPAERMKTQ